MNDDTLLIEEAQRGDKNAFGKLIQLYQKKTYNYALRLTRDPDLSQDLCQEAFIKAFIAIRSFKGGASFATWIYRILHNTFLDHYRKEMLRHESPPGKSADEKDETTEPTEAGNRLFRERLQHIENNDWLAKGLLRLSLSSRSILILRDIQGFSYEEISEITSTSVGTVKSRLNRAREQLRRILSALDLDT